MYRIIDKRGTGKTSRLILLAKEKDCLIVCKNPQRLIEKAYAYGITGIKCISYEDFLNVNYDINLPVYIDDLDSFLPHIIEEANIVGYTLSEE